jgi:hypothetical protein
MTEELNGIVVSHKPISESSLKRLLLIFDKLYFIHPEENKHLIPNNVAKIKFQNMEFNMADYGVMYNGENYNLIEDNLLDKFDYAINKGIIRILDLKIKKFYEKNWLPLRLSYDFDTGNADLLNNFLPLTVKENNISMQTGICRGGFISPSNIKLYPDIPAQISFFTEEENKDFHLDHQLLSITGRLNRTLAISHEFNLIPIFINENLARAYSHKIEIAKNNKESKLNMEFLKHNRTKLESVQFLLHKISEILLPDDIINEISVKELIFARNSTYNECIKLRRKLIKTITFLSETNFDDKFLKDVDNYIKKEVEPLVNAYQKKFVESMNKFLQLALPFGSTVAGSVLGIQQGLSPMAIAYLGGISGTVGQVTTELSNYILKKRSKKMNNTFSYFINLKE